MYKYETKGHPFFYVPGTHYSLARRALELASRSFEGVTMPAWGDDGHDEGKIPELPDRSVLCSRAHGQNACGAFVRMLRGSHDSSGRLRPSAHTAGPPED